MKPWKIPFPLLESTVRSTSVGLLRQIGTQKIPERSAAFRSVRSKSRRLPSTTFRGTCRWNFPEQDRSKLYLWNIFENLHSHRRNWNTIQIAENPVVKVELPPGTGPHILKYLVDYCGSIYEILVSEILQLLGTWFEGDVYSQVFRLADLGAFLPCFYRVARRISEFCGTWNAERGRFETRLATGIEKASVPTAFHKKKTFIDRWTPDHWKTKSFSRFGLGILMIRTGFSSVSLNVNYRSGGN